MHTFSKISSKDIKEALNYPYGGLTVSERLWKQQTDLAQKLKQIFIQNSIVGKNPYEYAKEVALLYDRKKFEAYRLIYTESAYVSEAATMKGYAEDGIEEYEICATLDSHTSEVCRKMDGMRFKVAEAQEGKNMPPFHPFCRTTTVPYISELDELQSTRVARDEDGKTYKVPGNMKYLDWKKKYVKDAIKDSDRKLYEKYKGVLGNNAPSLEKFIEIRYNDFNWNEFKAYSSSIRSGELSAFADFDLYQSTSKEMDDKLLRIVISNNITITGKSKHSIARVIGSVEQKRNGVQVSDILDALTNSESEILSVRQMKNGRSQKFRNKVVEVSVNPDTGNIIQVNPVHSRRKVKS